MDLRPIASIACALSLVPAAVAANAASLPFDPPHADWRVIDTEHTRIHFPAPFLRFARYVAERVEQISEQVAQEAGGQPDRRVDIVIADPEGEANGMAVPFLNGPRIVLWATPPAPASLLGSFNDWPAVLAIHELAHIAQLTRPSRNPLGRALGRLLALGPIATGGPRWLHEGYATLIEGELTGSGRPNGALRAAVLREWASAGKLPAYEQLDGSTEFLGGSMAYLVGSAFLEWLSRRSGEDKPVQLALRLSAYRRRTFTEAFAGLYGGLPADVYGRFTAALTRDAMNQAELLIAAGYGDGEHFQDRRWWTGRPDCSPTGNRMAVVLGARDGPARLVVWGLDEDHDAAERERQDLDRLAQVDPMDVPDIAWTPRPREIEAQLFEHGGQAATGPRWAADGKSVLFTRAEPDASGARHRDLFRWWPETGRTERITRGADVAEADPEPGGTAAVAVRYRHGLSSLVRVLFATGQAEDLTRPRISPVLANPDVSPDGTRVALAAHDGTSWRIAVVESYHVRPPEPSLESLLAMATAIDPLRGARARDPYAHFPIAGLRYLTGEDENGAHPRWTTDGSQIVFASDRGGIYNLVELEPATGARRELTRELGAAVGPAPAADGLGMYYLALTAGGLDVRVARRVAEAAPAAPPPLARDLGRQEYGFTLPPHPQPDTQKPQDRAVSEPRAYGVGEPRTTLLIGGAAGSYARRVELLAHGIDLLGRLGWLLTASYGRESAPIGTNLGISLRRSALALSAQVFAFSSEPAPQASAGVRIAKELNERSRGAELTASWHRVAAPWELRLAAAALMERRTWTARDVAETHAAAALSADGEAHSTPGRWRLDGEGHLALVAGHGSGRRSEQVLLGVSAGAAYHNVAARGMAWWGVASRETATGDQFRIGGATATVTPDTRATGRIPEPAAPEGTIVATGIAAWRISVGPEAMPHAYFARYRALRNADSGATDRLDVWGVEHEIAVARSSLLGLPSMDVLLGAARIKDPAFMTGIKYYFNCRWHL
ncbi:MAG: PD40 domain-containing protein [Candidatus Schekmanbacteria bacterium]|nr:PD40 domain-containing protein [Candidatus Schekmanbacteria bacterium]